MPDTIYVYENHKITGPDGYNVDIIISDYGKEITIEGTDNIQLKREKGKYIISHNFLEEGNLERGSAMEYRGTNFWIPKKDMKKLRMLNFAIYSQNIEVAYINKFKNSLNINIEKNEYTIPVIIYIAVLSRELKEKFGKLYMKTGALNMAGSVLYPLLGISSLLGVSVNSPAIYIVSILIFVALPVASSIIGRKGVF
ncbi:hypothetical protein [Ferroplasma acidiphilum]|jgi:hypothetical protein|uniref:hypothetical protein n=1 Tax=Ferroplasma acidiphilum TaxID=74969 RepID=UPI0023F35DED|nr:hypothetical protein [Ferroplasma acidiphilum]MCL4349511.1 hypothetical protein [Candidatus Thermoplasmatota archaeon]